MSAWGPSCKRLRHIPDGFMVGRISLLQLLCFFCPLLICWMPGTGLAALRLFRLEWPSLYICFLSPCKIADVTHHFRQSRIGYRMVLAKPSSFGRLDCYCQSGLRLRGMAQTCCVPGSARH